MNENSSDQTTAVSTAEIQKPGHDFGSVDQLIIDCYDCEGPLQDVAALQAMLAAAAERVGATLLDVARCDYVPHGVSMVAFLAESHLFVSTWPEHSFAIVEIMLCNDTMMAEDAREIIESVMKPRVTTVNSVNHRLVSPL